MHIESNVQIVSDKVEEELNNKNKEKLERPRNIEKEGWDKSNNNLLKGREELRKKMKKEGIRIKLKKLLSKLNKKRDKNKDNKTPLSLKSSKLKTLWKSLGVCLELLRSRTNLPKSLWGEAED